MRNRSFFARSRQWLAAIVGAGLASATPVSAQTVSPSAAPAEWVRYAEDATNTISAWLGEDGEAATRFRTYLDQTRPAADQPTPPLELRVWIDPDGAVSRITFPPFAHEEANASLRGAIVGRRLTPPPADMLLPIRIAVQLDAPAAEPALAPASRPAERPLPRNQI
nr:hypothetical protein [uncultured Brevundimonas sp.]